MIDFLIIVGYVVLAVIGLVLLVVGVWLTWAMCEMFSEQDDNDHDHHNGNMFI